LEPALVLVNLEDVPALLPPPDGPYDILVLALVDFGLEMHEHLKIDLVSFRLPTDNLYRIATSKKSLNVLTLTLLLKEHSIFLILDMVDLADFELMQSKGTCLVET
jgi:hypothetical protein